MRIFSLLMVGILLLGCKKDGPKAPEAVLLVSPEKNSECSPIQSTNTTSNIVQFSWLQADHTDSYELRVTNLNTGTVQTKSTASLSETLPLQKGAPFSWVVISKNVQVEETGSSETWLFYNPGIQTSYPPFPPQIISPKLSESVFKDINNEVTLEWSGADIDDDITSYELYFSIETPPNTLIDTLDPWETTKKVSVSPQTVYYWKVIAKDEQGHASDSGVFNFRVY